MHKYGESGYCGSYGSGVWHINARTLHTYSSRNLVADETNSVTQARANIKQRYNADMRLRWSNKTYIARPVHSIDIEEL
jgi:hypothetical protein